ncbi:hypothetical protein ACVWZZ_001857 [Bradyrhizobium sp. LM6.10]
MSARILVVMPPFERPIAWLCVPLLRLLTVAVDLDDGGVDHGVFHVGIVGDGLEQPLPDIRLHPVAKARECAIPVAEHRRQIPPGTAGSGDPQNGLDKQSVVLAAAARISRLAKTMRLHLRPLGVSQNESVHPKLESQPSPDENPESQQTLGQCRLRSLVGLVDSNVILFRSASMFAKPGRHRWACAKKTK